MISSRSRNRRPRVRIGRRRKVCAFPRRRAPAALRAALRRARVVPRRRPRSPGSIEREMMTSAKPASAATARAPDAGKPGGRTSGEPATTENQNIISSLDVQLVQNLVERCLQLYMNQREVVTLLQQQTKIEPSFTSLVWQKLEEQNPEFFKARLEKALPFLFAVSKRATSRARRRVSFDFDLRSPHFQPRTRAHRLSNTRRRTTRVCV